MTENENSLEKKVTLSAVVITTFFVCRNMKYFWGYVLFGKETWNSLDKTISTNILIYSQIAIILLITGLYFKKNMFEALGISSGFLKGLWIGLLCTLPMFIGFAFLNDFQVSGNPSLIHRSLISAGFFEEFLFRGFLFGILFYYAGWGFVPAVLLPSIFFGMGHLYQAESWSDGVSIFLFTGLGSAGFAWFYTAWKNLWPVIFLHAYMDLAWDILGVEGNVTGNLWVNVFRFTTLGIMILLSIKNVIKNPEFQLNDQWWINKATRPI